MRGSVKEIQNEKRSAGGKCRSISYVKEESFRTVGRGHDDLGGCSNEAIAGCLTDWPRVVLISNTVNISAPSFAPTLGTRFIK